MSKIAEQKDTGWVTPLLILAIIIDAAFLLITPANTWIFVLAVWCGGPLIGNIINYLAACAIYKRTKIDPAVAIFLTVLFQIAVISVGILLISSAKGGQIEACADQCSVVSFGEALKAPLLMAQLFFIGAYLAFIICSAKDDIARKKRNKKAS